MAGRAFIRADHRQRNLLGLRVEDWTMHELVEVLSSAIVNRTPVHVWGISVSQLSLVRKHPEIVDFTHQFDIVTADGAGVPILGRLMGQKIRAHIGLPYVSQEMIELAATNRYRLLLFGATPDVNARVRARLREQYATIDLCPGIDGYYPPEAEAGIAERIRDLKPDILLVGMSFPKKEHFLLRWKDHIQVPVSVCCGGYFDVLAGKTHLAPKVIERMAMSWLWRFIQEPRRLFYGTFASGLIFIFYVFPIAMISRVVGRPLHILRVFGIDRT
jgi:N-acetylglucosaminyldiphosphoundecaprenol N-acetyl-beta-D-mannosaminyltransferase